MKEIPRQVQNELAQTKDKILKMPVVVGDVEYRPAYTLGAQHVEDQPQCLCCGTSGEGWIQCVEKIVEHGTDDVRVMQEIEAKLKTIVREVEAGMSVCEKCCYTEEFLAQRPILYKDTLKKILHKHNGRKYDLEW